jgi:uncharacterized protein YcbK (DUF882 family)
VGAEPQQAHASGGAATAPAPAPAPTSDGEIQGGPELEDGEGGEVVDEAAPPKSGKRKKKRSRRPQVSGRAVLDDQLRKQPLARPSGNLHLHNMASKEQVDVNIYNDDGSYNVDALRAADRILRCRRTDEEKSITPRLLSILSHVYDHFGGRRIEIVSGYRNQRKQSSYHAKASASDIRIDGVSAKALRDYVETLDTGGMGIGIYPRTGFVHVDIRPPPSYRWVDYSPSNPNAKEKRPPRGWKRKKLQS